MKARREEHLGRSIRERHVIVACAREEGPLDAAAHLVHVRRSIRRACSACM